jgi:uncharacterized protein (UPF0264 family)
MRYILLALLLVGCTAEEQEKVNTFYYIDPSVMDYVLDYERDIKSIGLSLKNDNVSFSIIVGRLPIRVAGIAIGMFNDKAVNVVLNVAIWDSLSRAEKKALVYHELSHDVFGLEHGTCDLMSGSLREITDEMVKELLDTLTKQQNK